MFFPHLTSTYFSQLKYLLGTRKEQIVSIEHQQKLCKRLTAGIFYRGIASPGFYKRQFNDIRNFSTFLRYNSIDKKYNATIYYFSNKIITEENGGLLADSLLNIYNGQERSIPVNLNSAEHKTRTKGFTILQFYNLRTSLKNDTIINDDNIKKFVGFEHSFEISNQTFVYTDAGTDSGYYLNNYFSDLATYDSLSFQMIANKIDFSAYQLVPSKRTSKLLVNFKLGIEVNSYKSHQSIADSSFHNKSANMMLQIYNRHKWNLTTKFNKLIDINNNKPYITETKFVYHLNNFVSKLGVSYRNQVVPPDFISEYTYTNHFVWQNNFDNKKESVCKLFVNLFNDQISLSAWRYTVKGHIFYDELFKLPHQYNSDVEINRGQCTINYSLGNWHWLSQNVFNFSSTAAILRFPKFDLRNTVYYQDYFFNKALLAAFGTKCHYQSAYYANGLNPANGQFYLQNEVKIGDYPYVDVFLDMTIRTVKIFVIIEHLNAGIGDRNYFYMPHYPTPPRTLKFGLTWTFKN